MSVVVGGNFADGKGNATGYLSYIDAQPTRLSERDFSSCQLSGQGTTSAADPPTRTTSKSLDGPAQGDRVLGARAIDLVGLGHARHEPAARCSTRTRT